MNYKEIEFKPYDPANNDINCVDGELEGVAGMTSPGLDVRFALEAGEVIGMHRERAIVYHQGKLMWALTADCTHIATEDLVEIAGMSRPASMAVMGDILITAGEGGLLYHYWCDSGYITLPQLPPLPKIEFGLLKKGEMADTCSLSVPLSMIPAQGGNGMTDPHPSANNTVGTDTSASNDKFVDTFISRAHDDKRARGFFTTPFFVRYALRDHGGNYLAVSPPVLMAGNVLPPYMEVISTSQDDKSATMRLRLGGCPYFSLMARACPLSETWMSVVKSVDIYVSPQIPTRISSSGYLCSYANVLGQVNGGSGHRGRENSSTSTDTMFAGHYSDDGVSYIDHFTDPSLRQTPVWYVSPNVAIAGEITREHRFYLIASLSAARLAGMTAFTSLPLETTVTSHLESLPFMPDAPESVAIFPDILATLNGRLVAGGGECSLAKPADPSIASAFSGSISSDFSQPVEVCVFTRPSSGCLRQVSASYDSSIDLTSTFPRFIYHPDSDAEMMTIESGGIRYCLPLTRHPTMAGSFWFGGFGADYKPGQDTDPLPVASDSDRISTRDRVWLSSPDSPSHFSMSHSIAACNGQVIAISPSVLTPDIAVIGKYPMYVFADDGVWLAEYDSGGVRLSGSHCISGEVCVSAAAIATTEEGVAFATDRSLLMLTGSKIRLLMSMHSLPAQSDPLFHVYEAESEMPIAPSPIRNPALAYDGAASSLIVADITSGTTCLCDIVSRTSTLWSSKVISLPLTPGRPLIQTDIRQVGYLSPSATPGGMIITRPIKLTKAFIPKIIRSVTVWHSGAPDSIALKVYGANSLSSWHLIASSPGHRVELPSRSRWRFIRLAIIPKEIGLRTEIFGAQLEWKDE